MKNKLKLLWNNKVRLITFALLTIITICVAFIIPIQQQKNTNLIDRGVLVVRGTSMAPTIDNGQVVYVSDISFERGAIAAVKNHSTIKYDSSTMPVLLKRIVGKLFVGNVLKRKYVLIVIMILMMIVVMRRILDRLSMSSWKSIQNLKSK